jgi:hypothetical protein
VAPKLGRIAAGQQAPQATVSLPIAGEATFSAR